MSREDARAALLEKITELKATGPDYPVEMPNFTSIDPALVTTPFMKVDIVFPGSYQASLGVGEGNKHVRVMGQLRLEVWLPPNSGTKPANELFEHYGNALDLNDELTAVRCQAIDYGNPISRNGWRIEPAVVPFWFDDYR